MQSKQPITIVLPLYNPKADWARQFVNNVKALNQRLAGITTHYIVVHDGPASNHTLSTFDVISEAVDNIRFIHYNENKGKGYALRVGVMQAKTQHVITTDFDFPYLQENITELLAKLQLGFEVVFGKRNQTYFSQLPLKRKLISRTYAFMNRVLFTLPVNDTQSGLKGFNVKGRAVFLQTNINRFLVDTEFLIRSVKSKLAVDVIDVHLRPEVTFTNFGWRVMKEEAKNLLYLVKINRKLKKQQTVIAEESPLLQTLSAN